MNALAALLGRAFIHYEQVDTSVQSCARCRQRSTILFMLHRLHVSIISSRYNDGLMDVTRLSAASELSSAADFAAAAAFAGAEDELGCDARTAEGGRCVVLSRR